MDEVAIVNGLSIAYRVEGHGEPVILLHGNGLSGAMWKYNIGQLARRFQVFAPDLPGFGRSDKPDADYGVEYYVAFLRSFMDALQIEKAALVGHSLLGVVAATFAARYPGRVTKLVLADACGVISLGSPVYKAALKVGLRATARSRTMFQMQLLHDGGLGPRLDGVPLVTDGKESRRAFYRNCREVLDVDLNYLWLLGQVRAPVLVLGGSCDRLVPPRGIRKYGEIIRGSRTVFFEKCAHLPNVENPEKFNAEVIGFLA
ncbi:MAG TPA: alpha/beta hydrolase [Methanocella sp.]|nr:alpha/beta hydrolase [Methanocella sp.]